MEGKPKKKKTCMPWTMTLADSTKITREEEEIEKYLDVVWGWNLYLLCKKKKGERNKK